MAEAIDSEIIHREMSNNEIEDDQQPPVELQPLLSSHQPPDHLSSDHFQQQQHVEDDELTIDIKEMIQDCEDGLLSSDCCIYKVPITFRHLKEKAYIPKLVSIGPFHYGNKRLQDMERYKQVLFKAFTEKATSSLDDLVRLAKGLEPKIRASYSETINLTEQQLVKMILMDAGFIIELFISCWVTNEQGNDAKLSQQWLQGSIMQDLLLIENQLPFFVIEELFNKAFPRQDLRSSLPSFLELTCGYFRHFNKQQLRPDSDVKIKHFTDLLRLFYLQRKIYERKPFSLDGLGSHILSYNVNALQEAGIKLKATTSKCLLDLKFSRNVLEIPQIFVDGKTDLVFRNMIALEQCLYPHAAYITDYAIVLDRLIDTHKDVDLLVHKKIVGNFTSGDANNVASLFNSLAQNVVVATFNPEYTDICKRLNSYCEDPWHKMKATLKRDYCRTPWQIVASIAAILLLFLTLVQTIFSILQVVI